MSLGTTVVHFAVFPDLGNTVNEIQPLCSLVDFFSHQDYTNETTFCQIEHSPLLAAQLAYMGLDVEEGGRGIQF